MSNILNIWDANTQQYVGIPAITGSSGVHYGTSEPTDPSHPVWIDPSGEGDTIIGNGTSDPDFILINSVTINNTETKVVTFTTNADNNAFSYDELLITFNEDATRATATSSSVLQFFDAQNQELAYNVGSVGSASRRFRWRLGKSIGMQTVRCDGYAADGANQSATQMNASTFCETNNTYRKFDSLQIKLRESAAFFAEGLLIKVYGRNLT